MVGENTVGLFSWGCKTPQKGYWKNVSKILNKYNIHLILDEIYCGMKKWKAF